MNPFFTPEDMAEVLISSGYRKVSCKFRHVARVDRPGGCKHPDQFRRCNSKDTLTLPESLIKLIPGSNHDKTGYMVPHPYLDTVKKIISQMI